MFKPNLNKLIVLRGEIPLESVKKAVFSILFWENENEEISDFLHILEDII